MVDDADMKDPAGRIILLLADGGIPRELQPLRPSDVVLLGGDVAFECNEADVRSIGVPSGTLQKQAAGQVAGAINRLADKGARLPLLAFANDLYAYLVRPTIAVAEGLLALMESRPSARVIVVHARRGSRRVPLVGFATNESPRGSRSLLGACIAQQLERQPVIAKRAEFLQVGGDLLCNESLRSFLVSSLDVAMRARFVWNLLLLRLLCRFGPGRSAAPGHGPLFIVRALHQARFARRIGDALSGIGMQRVRALVLPQFSQGSLIGILRELNSGRGQFEIISPDAMQICKAAAAARREARALRGAREASIDLLLSMQGTPLSFSFCGLCLELSRLRIFLLYRSLLYLAIDGMKASRAVNFELVGRVAGLDRFAADEAGCELRTVQTAVVSEVPHPVFPFSHVFYADGPDTAGRLARIGEMGMGVVDYGGGTLPLLPLHELTFVKDIAFFTQPYEPEITSAIIAALGRHCRVSGGTLRVKLHPRDHAARYREALTGHGDVMDIRGPADNPADVILQSDLCVTRTSSVAKEALAYGKPVILCLWSELDRSIRADYADPRFPDHLACDESRLVALLESPAALSRSAALLRSHLFSGSGIDGLATSIVGGKA